MAKHFNERQAALCDWLTANGIVPNTVPVDGDLTIVDTDEGRAIRLEVYVLDEHGRLTLDERGQAAAMEIRTLPLAVEPPAWWEPYEKPTRAQLLAAVERVRRLHTHVAVTDDCYQCSQKDYPDYSVTWPCPTIAALDGKEQPGA